MAVIVVVMGLGTFMLLAGLLLAGAIGVALALAGFALVLAFAGAAMEDPALLLWPAAAAGLLALRASRAWPRIKAAMATASAWALLGILGLVLLLAAAAALSATVAP